ncbi:MAG: KOW domain-containing RNA-binding protein [Clostridia bacterium]|nr:KOW domain-containing RNA-binding protein [Clostridia bacterium]
MSKKKASVSAYAAVKDENTVGNIVVSLAGRDAGRVFVTVGRADTDTVLLADGKVHTVSDPKKKKIKHLTIIGRATDAEISALMSETVQDSFLRRLVRRYIAERLN